MVTRSSGILLIAYLALAVAGIVYMLVPSPIVTEVAGTSFIVFMWGLFYAVGGFCAAAASIARKFAANTAPLWHFEVGGVWLIIAANTVYVYALVESALSSGNYNVFATALVIMAFSIGLYAWIRETRKLVKTLQQFSQEG